MTCRSLLRLLKAPALSTMHSSCQAFMPRRVLLSVHQLSLTNPDSKPSTHHNTSQRDKRVKRPLKPEVDVIVGGEVQEETPQ
ncbi:Secondary metabolism regulator LAE1 [Fusarium oxysporum f. sp. albedinis]|nr:Secondary metabolism regulator LAE1 [Fusarium oxysporum f. sp. albedinis]